MRKEEQVPASHGHRTRGDDAHTCAHRHPDVGAVLAVSWCATGTGVRRHVRRPDSHRLCENKPDRLSGHRLPRGERVSASASRIALGDPYRAVQAVGHACPVSRRRLTARRGSRPELPLRGFKPQYCPGRDAQAIKTGRSTRPYVVTTYTGETSRSNRRQPSSGSSRSNVHLPRPEPPIYVWHGRAGLRSRHPRFKPPPDATTLGRSLEQAASARAGRIRPQLSLAPELAGGHDSVRVNAITIRQGDRTGLRDMTQRIITACTRLSNRSPCLSGTVD